MRHPGILMDSGVNFTFHITIKNNIKINYFQTKSDTKKFLAKFEPEHERFYSKTISFVYIYKHFIEKR